MPNPHYVVVLNDLHIQHGFLLFFLDKFSLLKPILSRFCDIYIPLPKLKESNELYKNIHYTKNEKTNQHEKINLHEYTIETGFSFIHEKKKRIIWLRKYLDDIMKKTTYEGLFSVVGKIYNKGYSGLDLIQYIENKSLTREKKYELLLFITKIKSEYRNEELLMYIILYFLFFRSDYKLENISFM